jgi:hypothetical protein
VGGPLNDPPAHSIHKLEETDMTKTGKLEIDHNTGVSRLNSGPGDRKRLAKVDGGGNPLANATNFLVSQRNLHDGDFIFVTGTNGTHSGVPVIFITDAGSAVGEAVVISAAAKRLTTTKRSTVKKKETAKKASQKPSKKAGKKAGKKSSKKMSKKTSKKGGKTAKKK